MLKHQQRGFWRSAFTSQSCWVLYVMLRKSLKHGLFPQHLDLFNPLGAFENDFSETFSSTFVFAIVSTYPFKFYFYHNRDGCLLVAL